MASFLLPVGLGLASALGGFLGNKNKQTNTTTSTLDPQFQGLQGALLRMVQQRLAGSGGLSAAGLTNRRIAGVNQAYRGASTSLQNKLRAAGLDTSGVAGGAEAGLEEGRAGQIGGLIAQEPLIQQDEQNQAISQALGLLGTGRNTQTSTTTGQAGGGIGGALTDVGGILGFLYGNGMLGGDGVGKLAKGTVAPGFTGIYG